LQLSTLHSPLAMRFVMTWVDQTLQLSTPLFYLPYVQMKSLHILALTALGFASGLSLSCQKEVTSSQKLVAVTTPVLELFTHEILQDSGKVTRVFDTQGHCLHDHQVSTNEVRTLCSANLVIASGAGFESFLAKTMQQCPSIPAVSVGDSCADVNTSDGLRDPHLWLGKSGVLCELAHLQTALIVAFPHDSVLYTQRSALLTLRLSQFWDSLQAANADLHGMPVVSFHGAFGYLARDLGLHVVASFGEAQEDMNPSAQQIANLVRSIRENHVRCLLLGTAESPALAESVARETHVKILRLQNMMEGFHSLHVDAYTQTIRDDVQMLRDSLLVDEAKHAQ